MILNRYFNVYFIVRQYKVCFKIYVSQNSTKKEIRLDEQTMYALKMQKGKKCRIEMVTNIEFVQMMFLGIFFYEDSKDKEKYCG